MNILEAIADPKLFASWFKDHETWAAWRVFLAALFGLRLEDEALYVRCTGGRPLPTQQAREARLIVGCRGGKSFICSLVAVYLATFRVYPLTPGERGIVMPLAADRRQARVLFRYVKAFIEGVAMLRQMVENVTADAIEFNNQITIEIHTASFRSVRGYTVVAALCDEVAFWRSEDSANPDTEILAALRPAMATRRRTPGRRRPKSAHAPRARYHVSDGRFSASEASTPRSNGWVPWLEYDPT